MTTALFIYCLAAVLLCVNLLGLWAYSGAVRARTKTTPNEEDARTVARGAKLATETPPEVDRVLRAHANANANIVPFLILGLLYVMLGATAKMAWIVFGSFTVLRYLHSVAYVAGKQPWRTLFFTASTFPTLFIVIQIIRSVIAKL